MLHESIRMLHGRQGGGKQGNTVASQQHLAPLLQSPESQVLIVTRVFASNGGLLEGPDVAGVQQLLLCRSLSAAWCSHPSPGAKARVWCLLPSLASRCQTDLQL